jgi:MinD-like ATPase involved in chromosome partitioning or flagellar assembly
MESNDRLADFQYLWDGTEPDWVLVDVNPTHSNYESRFLVMNERTKIAMIIESDDQAREVITRMRNAGVKVI